MKQHYSSQRGGTILGFIVGALVGLGAALAVAVYVTKVPVPFMNKGTTTRGAEQDAQESTRNKDWNPNAPLFGKSPTPAPTPATAAAKPATAPTAATPAPANAVATKPASGASAAVAAKAERVEPARPASADPLGDLARAKAAGVPATADPFDYFVQAGAFRAPEDAEAQRAKLAMMGWEARVTEREQSGRTVYRVRVGPFGKRDDAEQIKDKFDGAGVESALVRVQR
jgi:cell division protein FtsN